MTTDPERGLDNGEMIQGTIATVEVDSDRVRVGVRREIVEEVAFDRDQVPDELLDGEAAVGQAFEAAHMPIGTPGLHVNVRPCGTPGEDA